MRKILIFLCLILLTGCSQITLEEKVQGQWIIVESTGILESDDGDYTEFYTTVDLKTKETTEYTRNSINDEFTELQTTEGEDAYIIVDYSGNQKIVSCKSSNMKVVYDIEYFEDYVEFIYNYSELETQENTSTFLDGKTSISFEEDKMVTDSVVEIDGYIGTTKTVLIKIND